MGVREKWSLRYVVGPGSKQNTSTDEYLRNFYVPRGGVENTENEKQKNRNADKGAFGNDDATFESITFSYIGSLCGIHNGEEFWQSWCRSLFERAQLLGRVPRRAM